MAPVTRYSRGSPNGTAEEPVAIGLASNGDVLEVIAAPDGATWSIILTSPGGLTCMLAVGDNWTPINRKAGEAA